MFMIDVPPSEPNNPIIPSCPNINTAVLDFTVSVIETIVSIILSFIIRVHVFINPVLLISVLSATFRGRQLIHKRTSREPTNNGILRATFVLKLLKLRYYDYSICADRVRCSNCGQET